MHYDTDMWGARTHTKHTPTYIMDCHCIHSQHPACSLGNIVSRTYCLSSKWVCVCVCVCVWECVCEAARTNDLSVFYRIKLPLAHLSRWPIMQLGQHGPTADTKKWGWDDRQRRNLGFLTFLLYVGQKLPPQARVSQQTARQSDKSHENKHIAESRTQTNLKYLSSIFVQLWNSASTFTVISCGSGNNWQNQSTRRKIRLHPYMSIQTKHFRYTDICF